jgi:hypothetical protein
MRLPATPRRSHRKVHSIQPRIGYDTWPRQDSLFPDGETLCSIGRRLKHCQRADGFEALVTSWSPVAILPNLLRGDAVDGEVVAFAGSSDRRVQAICQAIPKFADLLSRFTDAFGAALDPMVLIARDDMIPCLTADALLSFRDMVAVSVIPYSRSLNTVHRNTGRIVYSNSFWIHPWTLSKDNEYLTTHTPAFRGIHVVEAFRGQSSPELSVIRLEDKDFDKPLFEALLFRWKRHYFGKRARWEDRALFRSLNMAFQAASLPAGVGANIFDLGRSVSLWVSALEILSHPRVAKADLFTVYPLFEKLTYCESKVGRRRYAAYIPQWKKDQNKKKKTKEPRRPLPCWIYGKLFQARNHVLHGNRVTIKTLSPTGTKDGLFWLAPILYRLGLSGFLNLVVDQKLPYWLSHEYDNNVLLQKKRKAFDRQHMAERALLRIRK